MLRIIPKTDTIINLMKKESGIAISCSRTSAVNPVSAAIPSNWAAEAPADCCNEETNCLVVTALIKPKIFIINLIVVK